VLSLLATPTQSIDERKPWNNGAVRGTEHRRRDGKMPEGSRRWVAAIARRRRDEALHFKEGEKQTRWIPASAGMTG